MDHKHPLARDHKLLDETVRSLIGPWGRIVWRSDIQFRQDNHRNAGFN